VAAIDYAVLRGIATVAIAQFGRDAILRGGGTDTTVRVILQDYGARERDGSLIQADDRRAIVSTTAGVTPDPEVHRLVIDATEFRIVSVRTLSPASTTLYYDCQVRS
jgi:hypothetical protein